MQKNNNSSYRLLLFFLMKSSIQAHESPFLLVWDYEAAINQNMENDDTDDQYLLEAADLSKQLQKEMKKRSEDLEEKQRKYQLFQRQIETAKEKPSSDTIAQMRKLEAEIRIDHQAAQDFIKETQGSLDEKIDTVIEKIRKKRGAAVVLDARAVKSFADNLDITSEVVKELNAQYRKEKRAQSFTKSEKSNDTGHEKRATESTK